MAKALPIQKKIVNLQREILDNGMEGTVFLGKLKRTCPFWLKSANHLGIWDKRLIFAQ